MSKSGGGKALKASLVERGIDLTEWHLPAVEGASKRATLIFERAAEQATAHIRNVFDDAVMRGVAQVLSLLAENNDYIGVVCATDKKYNLIPLTADLSFNLGPASDEYSPTYHFDLRGVITDGIERTLDRHSDGERKPENVRYLKATIDGLKSLVKEAERALAEIESK